MALQNIMSENTGASNLPTKIADLNELYLKAEHQIEKIRGQLENLEKEICQNDEFFTKVDASLQELLVLTDRKRPSVFRDKLRSIWHMYSYYENRARYDAKIFSSMYTLLDAAQKNLAVDLLPPVILEDVAKKINSQIRYEMQKKSREKMQHLPLRMVLVRSGKVLYAIPSKGNILKKKVNVSSKNTVKILFRKQKVKVHPLPGYTGDQSFAKTLMILRAENKTEFFLCHEHTLDWNIKMETLKNHLSWKTDQRGKTTGFLTFQSNTYLLYDPFEYTRAL